LGAETGSISSFKLQNSIDENNHYSLNEVLIRIEQEEQSQY
jgi:hypothetical protein